MTSNQIKYWTLQEQIRMGNEAIRHNLEQERIGMENVNVGYAQVGLGYANLAEAQRHNAQTEANDIFKANLNSETSLKMNDRTNRTNTAVSFHRDAVTKRGQNFTFWETVIHEIPNYASTAYKIVDGVLDRKATQKTGDWIFGD